MGVKQEGAAGYNMRSLRNYPIAFAISIYIYTIRRDG